MSAPLWIALSLFSFAGLIAFGRYLHHKELREQELSDEEFNARLRGDL